MMGHSGAHGARHAQSFFSYVDAGTIALHHAPLPPLRRFQLFEWEDQPWLPAVFRDFITDHLRHNLSQPLRAPINRVIAARLSRVLARTGARRIVDLCSGGGGPLLQLRTLLAQQLGREIDIVLTDLYPNAHAFRAHASASGGAVQPRYTPTSALDVPAELDGLRTLFTALHHFRPDDVRRILADAAAKGQPIAVFEPLERRAPLIALATLDVLWRAFVYTPVVGRLSLVRLLFTYVLPVAPLMLAWDAMVSGLRAYTPEELRELARGVGGDSYAWEAGRFYTLGPFRYPLPTVHLIGMPAPS